MRILLLTSLFLASAAQAQIQSDWERANEDRIRQAGEKLVPPPPLDRKRLVELKQTLVSGSDFRYYVDWGSVIADEDLERENDEKTAAVHFLRFELSAAMRERLRRGAGVVVGVDHPDYRARAELPPEVRGALAADLN